MSSRNKSFWPSRILLIKTSSFPLIRSFRVSFSAQFFVAHTSMCLSPNTHPLTSQSVNKPGPCGFPLTPQPQDLFRAPERAQNASGERKSIRKIAGDFLIVMGNPRMELAHCDPESDGYFEYAAKRTMANPAAKHKGSGICARLKRWRRSRCFFKEARIAATKPQPGRKHPVRMELHSDVGGQKNEGILTDSILGFLTYLHIKQRCQKNNATTNCE